MIPTLILCVHLVLTSVYCLPCDHPRAWKCPNDTLCLDKRYEVCSPPPRNIQRCPNGGDVGNSSCTQERCKELYYYYVKCPKSPFCVYENSIDRYCPKDNDDEKNVFQTKCDLAEVTKQYYDRYHRSNVKPRPGRNCTCPSITNNTTSCSSYCDQLKLTKDEIYEYGDDMPFIQCEGANQCILKAQLCNGVQDCPNNWDELHCSEEFCRKHNKFKCPFENKCIEHKFAGDGDPFGPSQYARNKCLFNNDESNIFYVDQCHQKNDYICPKKNEPLSGIKDHCTSLDQSCIVNETVDVTTYIHDIHGLHDTYLWQCTPDHQEHIFLANVCNDIFDCYASGFNDESDLVCERLSFIRALAWAFSIVFGIGLLRF